MWLILLTVCIAASLPLSIANPTCIPTNPETLIKEIGDQDKSKRGIGQLGNDISHQSHEASGM